MNIRPIKSEQDYDEALAEVEKLWGVEEGTEQGDKLEVLLILIENYEKTHYPIDPPDPIEAIKFRLEQMDLSKAVLEEMIGSEKQVSEILNRRKVLTLNMIRRLHATLHIPLESLIGQTKTSLSNEFEQR